MAVAFDAVSPDTQSGAGVTSLTSGNWTISGSNRLDIQFMGTGDATAATHNNAKWQGSGGTALTAIASGNVAIGTHARVSSWRLIAPTATTNTAYGDWSASQGEASIVALSYTGVDQTTPVGTPVTTTYNTNGSGAATPSVNVSTNVGDVVIAVFFQHNTSGNTGPVWTATGGATTRKNMGGGAVMGGFGAIIVTELTATGATTTMSASLTSADANETNAGGVVAFVINAVAGPPPASPMGRRLYLMP